MTHPRPFDTGRRALLALGVASLALHVPVHAQSAADFYKGKTIRVASSTGAGGTMDLYLLLTMKHMEKHLPEGTKLVLEHRTGGGGAVMANYMYSAAPKDGLHFGMPVPALVTSTFSNPDGTRYDPARFTMLGRLVDLPRVFVARADSGIKTLQDAAKGDKEIPHGIMTVGTSLDQYMTAVNEVLGTKFKRVAGYTGGGPTFLAMEQGEVQSTTAEPANLLSDKWHLVQNGTINVLATLGTEKVAGLESAPSVLDMIPASHPKRGIVEAVAASGAIGLALIAPPDVPADRVAYLREVLKKTMHDPALLAEAKERKIPINFADGERLTQIVAAAAKAPEPIRQWFRDLAKPHPTRATPIRWTSPPPWLRWAPPPARCSARSRCSTSAWASAWAPCCR
ncbi:MAG: tripartite tricarboxylate transporter substrate-binding protein [Rubrivivax sp.]|nr:tripartite tricarboxylate transporter substrate-binding protein [Rubrivivax sp.]